MKKRNIFMACMALGITLFATGCKKDEVKDTFNLNAVIEEVNGGQKVHMEGFLPVWDNNDAIRVNSESCTVSITGTGANRKNSIAKQVEENTYCAFYPASYLDANTNITNHSGIWITLPQRQDYIVSGGNQTVRMPMIAYSNTTDLHFKNLCSVLKVTVTNTTGHTFKLDSIQVKCDNSNLWGRCSVSLGNYTSVSTPNGMSGLVSGGKVVTLCGANKTSMNESFDDRAAKIYYIVVPKVDNADTFRIRLCIEEGFLFNMKTPGKKSIARNRLISMPFSAEDFEQPIDVILGPFTVDANGTKVSFSTGNLWYSRNDNGLSGDGKFHFESHQYDYTTIPHYGYANAMHISHFWWDNVASNTYGSGDTYTFDSRDWLFTNKQDEPTKAHPTFEVEGVKGKFRTLSEAEWNYLTETGSGSRTSDLNFAYGGCAVVQLTDVIDATTHVGLLGLVILPDPATNINPATLTTMAAITAAGAAFLPEAGGRWDPQGNGDVHTYNEQVVGVYWASDNANAAKARSFTFAPGSVYTAEGNRETARSIRVVCKYEVK